MLQVVLFRPHQRQRQAWVERLRKSGYDIRFVHDPERVAGETDLIVIDTAVGRWREYVRLVWGQGVPIVLLVGDDAQWESDGFTSFGVAGTVTQEEETDRIFARFQRPEESNPTGQVEAEVQATLPQKVTVSGLENEQVMQRDTALGSTLSQRKARQRSADSKPLPTEDGGEDWSSDPPDGSNAPIARGAPPAAIMGRSRDLPSVAAVYAAKGGVGKTTFLLHLASRLAKEGRHVCVLDLDLMHGSVASMLHIQPNKTITELVRRIDNPSASRACLLQTKMGFSVVAAPLQPCTLRMKHEQLLAVLRFLKEETDIVLIDTPVHFDSLVKFALEQAEQLFLMTTDEPASIGSLMRMKPVLSGLQPTPELYTVWTRFTEQAQKEQWRENIPWPVILELPEDPTVGKAVRSGQWIASSPCSPYRLRVEQLVDRWLGKGPNRIDVKRNLFSRLLFGRDSI